MESGGKDLPRTALNKPGEAIKNWMKDPDNYRLEYESINRSAGASINSTGPGAATQKCYWVAPTYSGPPE